MNTNHVEALQYFIYSSKQPYKIGADTLIVNMKKLRLSIALYPLAGSRTNITEAELKPQILQM